MFAGNNDDNSLLYDLYAVINHYGASRYSGHYTAICKLASAWYHFNDSRVESVWPQNVVNRNATLLFYKRMGFELN